jgi:hypothetical protein
MTGGNVKGVDAAYYETERYYMPDLHISRKHKPGKQECMTHGKNLRPD